MTVFSELLLVLLAVLNLLTFTIAGFIMVKKGKSKQIVKILN